jgi:hypothetical protein
MDQKCLQQFCPKKWLILQTRFIPPMQTEICPDLSKICIQFCTINIEILIEVTIELLMIFCFITCFSFAFFKLDFLDLAASKTMIFALGALSLVNLLISTSAEGKRNLRSDDEFENKVSTDESFGEGRMLNLASSVLIAIQMVEEKYYSR